MKSALTLLTKSVFIPVGLKGAASETDAAVQKKYGPGTKPLIISNKEIDDIMKIVKFLEKPGLLIKCISETFENEAKQQKGGFLFMILGTLAAILLAGKGVIKNGEGVIRADEGQDF